MDYISIAVYFVGGLGLFIYGMQIMANGLQKAAGNRMKKLLQVLTTNKFLGVLLGAVITAIIQSSSATTVMVVGFVNAGIMNLSQAMGVIMGANIGTTVTGWIVSSSDWAKFLSPTVIAPCVIFIGVILMLSKKKYTNVAEILVGFGILFIGIGMMSDAVRPLRELESFRNMFLELGSNPILGVLAGALITAIIQSSSASVGILQSLAAVGLVPFNAAIYIIMGQNIGTCITAILSSIGTSKTAKSAAYMHLVFNIVGTIIFGVLSVIFFKLINPLFGEELITMTQISIAHTLFNVANTILLYPFSDYIIAIARKLVGATKEDNNEDEDIIAVHLDDRMLESPSLAVQSAFNEVLRMGQIVSKNMQMATEVVFTKDRNKLSEIFKNEKKIDELNRTITEYLVKICNTNIDGRENDVVTSLMHVINDIERVGDHCENIAELTQLMIDEETEFSEVATVELKELIEISTECYHNSLKALEFSDLKYAQDVVREEDIIDEMENELRIRHIHRLSSNQCVAASGIVFLDTLTNLERMSDHALNIAESVINSKRLEKNQVNK